MTVLGTRAADRESLDAALSRPDQRLVICLCAAWCDTCEEFKVTFAHLARSDPDASYIWIDIEDDSELVGDIDIENFPTIAVYRAGVPVFFGVTLPQESVVARTLAALASRTAPVEVHAVIAGLPEALRARSR